METDADIRYDYLVGPAGSTVAVATPVGEFDVSNAADFKAQLLAALARTPAVLVLDLSRMTFLDSTVLGALVAVHRRACAMGTVVRLANPTVTVIKLLTLTALDRVFPTYPTVHAAATARVHETTSQNPQATRRFATRRARSSGRHRLDAVTTARRLARTRNGFA
jgi:anti-anti-sigma factor